MIEAETDTRYEVAPVGVGVGQLSHVIDMIWVKWTGSAEGFVLRLSRLLHGIFGREFALMVGPLAHS